MRRAIRLFYRYAVFSVMTALEYRSDFIITATVRLLESAIGFLVIIFLFRKIQSLSGWSGAQVLLINITYSLGTGLSNFLFKNSLKQVAESLNRGNIDRYLSKPIDFQLLISLGGFDWTQIFRIVFSLMTITWLVNHYSITATYFSGILYFVLVLSSVFIFYFLGMLIIFSTLYFSRINNITYLPYLLWDFGKFPTTVYHGLSGVIFSVAIPVIFSATVPVAVLVQKYPPVFLVYSLIAALSLFFVSRIVMTIGLRRYSSASS